MNKQQGAGIAEYLTMLSACACQMKLSAAGQNVAKEYITLNDQRFFILQMVMGRQAGARRQADEA